MTLLQKIARTCLFVVLSLAFLPASAQDSTADSLVPAPVMEEAKQPLVLTQENFAAKIPEIALNGIASKITFVYYGDQMTDSITELQVTVNGSPITLHFKESEGEMQHGSGANIARTVHKAEEKIVISGKAECVITAAGEEWKYPVKTLPGWVSILPPLIAILMALVFREVITALFFGIFLGAAIIHVYVAGVMGIGSGLLAVLDTYIREAVADNEHVSVILFSMLIGGLVALISRNGGMQGVVNHVSRFAKNAKSGQLATWFLGLAIFFDDYANTLVVGNTMRPVTDRLRISREKLSYLVDSTAAPVAAIAFITTWIGAELGYIGDGIAELKVPKGFDMPSPYGIFMGSLQYSFYPILTIIFMLILILRNRDFGPMYKAEVRARTTGAVSAPAESKALDREKEQELDDLEPVHGAIPRWINAVIPITVVIIGTLVGLIYTGYSPETWGDATLSFTRKLSLTIGSADSYSSLLWASLSGLAAAILLTLVQRIMNLSLVIESVVGGFKTMLHAMMILILAWSLAKVTKDLHTADYITSLLSAGISPFLIPAITFLLAGVVSFSTGSSWGTMAILYPLLIPAVWSVSMDTGLTPEVALPLLYNTVACVLAGSVLGDHCSPISDTTILSSLSTSTNHIDHVRTQLPYALTVGVVCVLAGTIPAAYGLPAWATFPLGIGVLYAIIQFIGKPIPAVPHSKQG